MNIKKIMKFLFVSVSTLVTFSAFASISPVSNIETSENSQIINLNMKFQSHKKVVKSELAMPFYQTAELEKKINNKNLLIEVNPRRGKNNNEVAIEMKFYKQNGAKAFAKKEVVAKIGEESKISVNGISIKVTPVL